MTNAPDPRRVSYLPLSDLKGDPRNPKAHDLETIDASIGRFGVLDLIVKDERTGYIISGHGRRTTLSAMQDRGETPPEGVKVDEDTGEWLVPVVTGWASRTDAEAAAALIALNRTTELGGWVDDALLDLLDELDDTEDGLVGVGYGEDDIEALRAGLDELENSDDGDLDEDGYPYDPESADDEDEENLEPSGQSFKTLDVLVGEPKHVVKHGEVYRLGGRHYLVIAKLAREHDRWSHLLEGRVFAPYPDVYLALGKGPKAEEHLFVQPNLYLAGHLLDKWASVHGEDSIVKEVAS